MGSLAETGKQKSWDTEQWTFKFNEKFWRIHQKNKMKYINPTIHTCTFQLLANILYTVKRDEQFQNIIGSLEYSENPEISHPPLNSNILHETSSTQYLNRLITHIPGRLTGKYLAVGKLSLVLVF